nr:diguanylate cyclase [Cellulomonas sp. APG4]
MVAELDHVAEIVDLHGRDAAEAALTHVAGVLRAAVRPDDTVARLGGGQLAVLMPGVGPEAVALRGEALRRRVRDSPVPDAEGPLAVTVTFGVAHTASGHRDLDRLQAIARERLEAARRRGPGHDPAS